MKTLSQTALARIQRFILTENSDFLDAVDSGNYEQVKKLLKSSRVNSFSKFGQTPLGYACANLDLEMVNLLLDNGANPNIYSEKPPLLYAIETAHNWHNTSGLSKDMQAALETHENNAFLIMKRLIDANADINYTDKKGSNLLISAAYAGNDKIVQLLIELGADTQIKNQEGKSVFHYALMGENKTTIKMLCEIACVRQLQEYQEQIPEGYRQATATRALINALLVYKNLDEGLVMPKEVKRVVKI